MAKPKLKEKAIKLRKKGMSYSQIREEVDVAKSTLSNWLRDHPLSKERIRELRDNNPRRIEKFRETMRDKRLADFDKFFKKAKGEIGTISKREKLIAGFYLYWGEGGKTKRYSISISNTDPAVLISFIDWLKILGVDKKDCRVTLHLYEDMNEDKEMSYWQEKLGVPESQFNKPYIKDSKRTDQTYKSRYQHGTCNVAVGGKDTAYLVHMGLKYIRERYLLP